MKFREAAEIFELIEQTSSRTEITKLLAQLFAQCSPSETASLSYMLLGELNPPYIGTQFNFAQKSMLSVLATFLDKTKETVQNYIKKTGDFGLAITNYMPEKKVTHELSVTQVNKALHTIHDISGTGSQELKAKEILDLLEQLDAISSKYVVRMILGKLRLGFSDMTIIDAFSWMEAQNKSLRGPLEEAYNICADIGLIGKTMKEEGIEGIKKMKIHCGIPLRPAAAERLESAKAIFNKVGHSFAEPKIDGFRLQLHVCKQGSKHSVHFFSRNLIDMSEMFPELTKEAKTFDVDSLIAEGEAIAYAVESDTFLHFQETVSRKRKHGIEEAAQDIPLKLYLFDILYLNGKDLLEKPLHERRKLLTSICPVREVKSHRNIQSIEEIKINSAKDLEDYFDENITAGLEGIMVKKVDSIYQAGKRNFNWIKLKREETGHLEDTIDCVILGYNGGHGKRASFGIGAFLVGVYNKKEDCFQTIAKVGSGLSDDEWRALKKRCDSLAINKQPKNVECAKELIPDVWVSPEIVCSIRADEITHSPTHTAGKTETTHGFALRFPRFMAYRDDKGPFDATTVKEIQELYDLQFKTKKKKK